ncbi:hypothetical protein E2C01_052821 [Portunus trituberculatus]|uniref:Uncharacterized protein n=1 Tax=Portunus trituberculatus TaxID=210409 RepID=A0A5B7GIP8_PORTR|nr:hypothetical protein [Portunus trituberculatus]
MTHAKVGPNEAVRGPMVGIGEPGKVGIGEPGEAGIGEPVNKKLQVQLSKRRCVHWLKPGPQLDVEKARSWLNTSG